MRLHETDPCWRRGRAGLSHRRRIDGTLVSGDAPRPTHFPGDHRFQNLALMIN
jgi:hypothetical protein